MPPPPEQPFNDQELRYFLAEILKTSSIAPADLVQIILANKINPQWNYIALPNGRSLAACQHQYFLLTRPNPGVLAPVPLAQNPPLYQFAPINEPSNPATFQTTTQYPPGETPDKTGKKRGRPSKAERELREAEAASRGEVYQPTKRKPKTPRPSTEGELSGEVGETSGSRKKAKKQKIESGLMEPPIQSLAESSTLRPAVSATGEQMQVDTPEHLPRSTIPETQASEFGVSESLLRGMQEHTTPSESTPAQVPPPSGPTQFETAQSSATLQQGTAMGEQQSPRPRDMPKFDHNTHQAPEATMS